MAKNSPILPFPSELSREAFAHWLSGFTDGEGSFCLYLRRPERGDRWIPKTSFTIGLRADDAGILKTIQSFFGLGDISNPQPSPRRHPACQYSVRAAVALQTVIVPHFELYPLRAKKRRDFEIWKRGVALCCTVATEPRRAIGYGRGCIQRWTTERVQQFMALRDQLEKTRAYESGGVSVASVESNGFHRAPGFFDLFAEEAQA